MIRAVNTQISSEVLASCIKEHQLSVPRLNRLYGYYKGNHSILNKTVDNPLAPNNRIVAPNAYYITTVANGFTFANPIIYKGEGIKNLISENKLAKASTHDAEMGENLSIYGRAYELVHMSFIPLQHVKLSCLDPAKTFVVFSNEIDPEPIFAVYYYPVYDNMGKLTEYEINVYDDWNLYVYSMKDLLNSRPRLIRTVSHYAGKIPIIEYKNNDEGLGDYERVISLIDAYDHLMSDRIDDKDQFIDSIMTVYGATIVENEKDAPEVIKMLKDYKILQDLPTDSRIEYLKKALDETGVEVLRAAIKSDISKFSLVPELTDENFAGNASGVAMEYKTLGLKWLANIKRRMFEKSLSFRLQIMNNYMIKLGRGFDWVNVDIAFDDALPIDVMAYLPYAKDILSRKTMVSFLAGKFGISNVDAELAQVEKEQLEAVDNTQPTVGSYSAV